MTNLMPLALTDLSTGEDLLVWGVDEGALDDLLRRMDEAARAAGAVGAAMVDLKDGKVTVSEAMRAWIEEGPRAVEEAEGVLADAAGSEGGPQDGR